MSVLSLTPTETNVVPRQCALTSTSPLGAGAETAATRTCAAAAPPTATPSKTALSNNPVPHPGTREFPDLVSVARSKVEQQRCHQKPFVSSRIDIYRLELELTDHPDRNFVFNLPSTLK